MGTLLGSNGEGGSLNSMSELLPSTNASSIHEDGSDTEVAVLLLLAKSLSCTFSVLGAVGSWCRVSGVAADLGSVGESFLFKSSLPDSFGLQEAATSRTMVDMGREDKLLPFRPSQSDMLSSGVEISSTLVDFGRGMSGVGTEIRGGTNREEGIVSVDKGVVLDSVPSNMVCVVLKLVAIEEEAGVTPTSLSSSDMCLRLFMSIGMGSWGGGAAISF